LSFLRLPDYPVLKKSKKYTKNHDFPLEEEISR